MSRVRRGFDIFRGYRVPHLRIVEHRKWWFLLSGFFVALSIAGLLFGGGLTLSIDFAGGALVSYPNTSGVTVARVEQTLATYGRSGAEVQIIDGKNGPEVSIRTEPLASLGAELNPMLTDLAAQAGVTTSEVSRSDVSATWGKQISSKALEGLIIFLVLVTVYIAFRFEWKMAASAQTALLHDIIITIGIYALTGREVTPATIIAFLTILGYSLYDTVVIFDKVQENTESAAMVARDTYAGVVNMSLNQTLMRSVNTSLVVLLPILSLLLFGGSTLKDFAFALFVGVATGTYSSIFMASPLLVVLKEREPKYRQLRDRKKASVVKTRGPEAPAQDVAKELAAAGVVKQTAAKPAAAASSQKQKVAGKGSGGSKKATTAKQRRRR